MNMTRGSGGIDADVVQKAKKHKESLCFPLDSSEDTFRVAEFKLNRENTALRALGVELGPRVQYVIPANDNKSKSSRPKL